MLQTVPALLRNQQKNKNKNLAFPQATNESTHKDDTDEMLRINFKRGGKGKIAFKSWRLKTQLILGMPEILLLFFKQVNVPFFIHSNTDRQCTSKVLIAERSILFFLKQVVMGFQCLPSPGMWYANERVSRKELKLWEFQALPWTQVHWNKCWNHWGQWRLGSPTANMVIKQSFISVDFFLKGGGNRQRESNVTGYCLHFNSQEWFA